jgi:hypothetical protein
MVWGGITAHGRTCDVVGLSLDERNDIRLNNFIPIAYTGQISGDNNQWCSAMCCYASPHHNTATTKEMGSALIRIWNNIPQAFFNNLVRSIRRRCQACMVDTHATDFGNV